MYKIYSDGKLLGYCEQLSYIKKASNGCYVVATAADAQGLVYKSTPYSLPNSQLDENPVAFAVEASIDEVVDELNTVKASLDYVMMMTDTVIPEEVSVDAQPEI